MLKVFPPKRVMSSMASAVQYEAFKGSSTYMHRMRRKEEIAERLGLQVKEELVQNTLMPEPAVSVQNIISKKTGEPLYMIKTPQSSADAYREYKRRVRLGLENEEPDMNADSEYGEKESRHKYSSKDTRSGMSFGGAMNPLLMMLATGVAVEGLVFYAKESRENPPGKLIQLYSYLWEKRLTGLSGIWK
jgi:hypothetical protein